MEEKEGDTAGGLVEPVGFSGSLFASDELFALLPFPGRPAV